MEANIVNNNKINTFNILLVLFLATISFWIIGQLINVYQYAAVGAIFELLQLPAILCILSMPIVSFYFWYKENFKVNSKFLYLCLGTALSIVVAYLSV